MKTERKHEARDVSCDFGACSRRKEMTRKLAISSALVLVAALAACGPRGGGREIKSGRVGGVPPLAQQESPAPSRAPSGKTGDVGAASLNFYMPARGTMPPMNSAATLKT